MKKFMSLVLCLALGSFALAGCSDNSEPFQEKTYTPDVPVSGIDLDVRDREIQVPQRRESLCCLSMLL